MAERIALVPCDLRQQFIKKIVADECYLELHEKHLFYRCFFYADEPKDAEDKLMGLIERRTDITITCMKRSIAGLEKSITVSGKRWTVSILVTGFQTDINCYFKKENEAQQLYDKLHEWLIIPY